VGLNEPETREIPRLATASTALPPCRPRRAKDQLLAERARMASLLVASSLSEIHLRTGFRGSVENPLLGVSEPCTSP